MSELSTEQLIRSLDVHLDTSLQAIHVSAIDLTAYRDRLKAFQKRNTAFHVVEEQPQPTDFEECKDALMSIINLSRFDDKVKDTAAWTIAYEVCNAKGYI